MVYDIVLPTLQREFICTLALGEPSLVAEEHQGYHTVSDYFLQNDPEPVAWRTR